MTEAELRNLIACHEADRVEFTISTKDIEKFSEAVCAFANDLPNHGKPGYLILGVDDRGQFAGLTVNDMLLRTLAGLRDDGNIQPLPSLTVEKVLTVNGEVAVVAVQPSLLPPVRYKGRVCIRIGPRRAYATEHDERRLIERRVAHARTFDAEPCLGATLDDLVLPLFLLDYRQHAIAPEVIAENGRPVEQQLAALRFFDPRHRCPTNAGMLLFGAEIQRWLPGAYVQFLHIDGTSLSDPVIAEREIAGDLMTVLRTLTPLVEVMIAQRPVVVDGLRERIIESFPRVAVRELLMNAIMHRCYQATSPVRVTWFADRLEIQNPGGLYGEATRENFPDQTSYRNPVVADALKTLGYVNRYGRGIARAREALARNGSPPPDFKFDRNYLVASVRRLP